MRPALISEGFVTLGLTGTRRFPYARREFLKRYLSSLGTEPDRVVSGACVGFDHAAGEAAIELWPRAQHLVVVPSDHSRVAWWWRPDEVTKGFPQVIEQQMPAGTTYEHRNQAIVDHSTVLVYCAEYEEDDLRSQRSGTGQTVRMAVRAGLPVFGLAVSKVLT